MNKLLLTVTFILSLCRLPAQSTVHITGQIVDFIPGDIIYLADGESLMELDISKDGKFSADMNFQSYPAFFTLKKSVKGSKIEQLLPRIWFENDSISVTVDLINKSFQTQDLMPYQEISERIEGLKGKSLITYLKANPNHWPSVYFADRQKEKIPLSDLEEFTQNATGEYKSSIYVKRIQGFLDAKKRDAISKGKSLEDFNLPEKNGTDFSILENGDKPKLITVFSSTCAFSIASIDLLAQLDQMSDDKLEIITIWEDGSKDTWLNAHKEEKEKITWVSLWDEHGFASTYLKRKMWPEFYIVSPEGVLIDRFKGYNQKTAKKLRAMIE